MKTINKALALVFLIVIIAAPFAAAMDSDGDEDKDSKINITKAFDDMSGGTVEVSITGAEPGEYTVKITALGGEHVYSQSTLVVKEGETSGKTSLSWNFGGGGDFYVEVHILDGGGEEYIEPFDRGVVIHSNHSIWKDWQTYLVIVVVIIAIAIIAFIKVRGLPGSKKEKPMAVTSADKPFTRLEEERKTTEKKTFFSKKREEQAAAVQPANKEQPVQPDTSSTEKQTYSPGRGFFKKRKE